MPVRLAQFYAFVLLLICLAVNVAFFSDVRESFLGDADPFASTRSAFAELDIAAKISAFYPSAPSKTEEISDEFASVSVPPESPAITLESLLPVPPLPEPVVPLPVPVEPPALWEELPVPPEAELTEAEIEEDVLPADYFAIPAEALQSATFDPFPQPNAADFPEPVAAAVTPVVADQFKPLVMDGEPLVPNRPSSAPIWGSIDTILERPLRYD